MRSVGGKKILDKLDRVIARYGLHNGGGLLQPVSLSRVMEAFWVEFRDLPEGVLALLMRERRGRREDVSIALNTELKEDWASARRRHVSAHEYGHIVCDHKGSVFVMSGKGEDEVGRFDRWIDMLQEKESEEVAAYLLVPGRVLREMPGMERWYIARMLDVPEHLVKIRGELLQKWGR